MLFLCRDSKSISLNKYLFIALGITPKEDKKREALLEAMMYISETQSHSIHSRAKRSAKKHHRRRPNWKDHPLYPLYPIDFEGKFLNLRLKFFKYFCDTIQCIQLVSKISNFENYEHLINNEKYYNRNG